MSNATVELMMPFFQFLYHHYFRVDVEGAKNIARNGPRAGDRQPLGHPAL